MSEAKHTPGPWRYIEADNLIVGGDGGRLATVNIAPRSLDYGKDGRSANAERIVQCVNAHDGLQAMADEYQAWIDFHHRGDGDYTDFMRARSGAAHG